MITRTSRSQLFQAGFTLVELLVVISIIGVLSGLLLTNFVGVRGRAGDAKTKNDLRQLKAALRLYYNDYQAYPIGAGTLNGCGDDGDLSCSSGSFSAGAGGGTVYMKELPTTFAYYSDGGDDFLVVAPLENVSDSDIGDSQARCSPNDRSYFTAVATVIGEDEFVVCED